MSYTPKQFIKDFCTLPAAAGANALKEVNAYGLRRLGAQQKTSDKITSSITGAALGIIASYAITTGTLNAYENLTKQETTTQTPEEIITTTTAHLVSHQSKRLGAIHPVIGATHHLLTREPVSHTIVMRGKPQEDLERITITAPPYNN